MAHLRFIIARLRSRVFPTKFVERLLK